MSQRHAAKDFSTQDDATLGVTEAEAASRLAADGYNELSSAKPRNLLRIISDVVLEPMFLMLLVCGAIYLVLGNPREAAMLLFFVFVVMAITLIQQHRAERSLDALKQLSSPRALVIRRGPRHRIPGREVVVGDLVVLAEGDRVPADGLLVYQNNVHLDEALLTGESANVRKIATTDLTQALPPPGGDDLPGVYAGTLVVQGNALLHVLACGQNTALGKIGTALASIETTLTPIQREVQTVVKRVAAFAVLLSIVIALGYGLPRGQLLEGLLAGVTFAMAILPEELPVVMTLFLGFGAWRLAQKHVLTRRVAAIETLGTATVLCVDKTGTLTKNHMRVEALLANSKLHSMSTAIANGSAGISETSSGIKLPESFHELLEFSVLASHRNPFDPMEMAIHTAISATLANTEHVHNDWTLVDEYPLSPEMLAMSRVWQSADRELYSIAAKGAPEAIIDLCHLDAEQTATVMREVTTMAAQGLRVLGVARANFQKTDLPPIQHDFDFEFLGVIGLADPVREDVPAAIAECHHAGIRVVMITGDFPPTALNIGRQIGIVPASKSGSISGSQSDAQLDTDTAFITGADLQTMDENALSQRIRDVNIFCRVSPAQKLQIVKAFQRNGEIVAMTGDGVNDAPAIRAAQIGIAMGARGTDVAREAADLVLMDDAFASIVAAVRMGRRTYDNLTKAITFVIAVHVPIVGLSLLPLATGLPLILLPVHILFLQLIIDPACSIVFEAEPGASDLMSRPPRSMHTGLFPRATLFAGLLQGLVILLVLGALYLLMLRHTNNADMARTLTYATMVLTSIGLILSNLSGSSYHPPSGASFGALLWTGLRGLNPFAHSPVVKWICGATLGALLVILSVPLLRDIFFFARLSGTEALLCGGAAALCVAGFALVKWALRRPIQTDL